MVVPVHHLPGRLRARCRAVKGDRERAAAVAVLVRAQTGVTAVEVNPVTGSLVAWFDPAVTSGWLLLHILDRAGYGSPPSGPIAHGPQGGLGTALATSVVEKLLERSALALLGAVL